MPPTTSPTIEVNGYALRVIRVLTGIDAGNFSAAVGVDRSYLNKLENGQKCRVSPSVFDALCRALSLKDRRALMADPHGSVEEGAA
ncbi:DNA-binding Xre family transcriptional regulator [Lentzea atacamensis]|uniref:DNA-binding Xre family transcriptional regulator n=1 Tax=Lentzea atacamensis TaxID=531938 RepID=A0A316HNR5_9PSEU|nr:helix-turn-helix transcriptional regulator [Lentzea atacamensis]PWK81648.1 DNA-binding Xre family transcriptional regulator [Lentzea atacamensis]